MSPMIEDDFPPPSQETFQLLQNNHKDMISASAFNYYGSRFASSSVDGKIKVYDKHKDGTWNLCDTWGAHNAEILQLQWLPPTLHPNLLASISNDGRFKLWAEDPTVAPLQGRRFNPRSNRPVYELRSTSHSPFTSFSMRHNKSTRHTYLALITRSAVLILYENDEPENLENWVEIDRVNVSDKPARGEETSFRVSFDPNIEPTYSAVCQGMPRDTLGLVIASSHRVTIWRTKEISHNVSLGSSSTRELYLAAECKGHRSLVRDAAWAPGNMRGYDIVATACKDGFVRVFQVTTPAPKARSSARNSREIVTAKTPERVANLLEKERENGNGSGSLVRNSPSGIGAGLANARPGARSGGEREGEIVHVAKEIAQLADDGGRTPVWKVEFDDEGLILGSVGDDGKLIHWRRAPSGAWIRSSELTMARSFSIDEKE